MFRPSVGSHGALRALAAHDLRGCELSFLGLRKNAPLERIHARFFSDWTKDERSASKATEILVDIDIGFGKKRAFKNLRFPEQGGDPVDWISKIDIRPDDIEFIVRDKSTGELLRFSLGEASEGEEAKVKRTQTYRLAVALTKEDGALSRLVRKAGVMPSGVRKFLQSQVGFGAKEETEAWDPVEWNEAACSNVRYAANLWLTAAENGDLGTVRRLCLRDDVNKRAVNSHEQTALHLAAGTGHLAVVEHLVTAGGFEDLDVQDMWGNTALHKAAGGGHTNVVQYLISKKASIDAAAPYMNDCTPLHYAANGGRLETVKLLVAAKCDIGRQCRNGFTALRYAKLGGFGHDVVEYLESQGCPR